MEWNDGSDDDQYPVAPVPSNERAWRHPSEIGQAQWTRTEPPLTIGRGLVAATTTLGGLLTIAVAWAMWPSTGAGVTALSTVVSVANAPARVAAPSLTTSSVGLTEAIPTSALVVPSSTLAAPQSTLASATTTIVQVATTQPAALTPVETASAGTLPRAAAVTADNGEVIIVTTAAAVSNRETLQVTFDGSTAVDATVVFVDQRAGIAVLSADIAVIADVPQLLVGAVPTDSTFVTTLAGDGASLDLVADDAGVLWIADWASSTTNATTAEGMPLIDEAGALVGLCTHKGDGMVLVRIDQLTSLHVPAQLSSTPRMGVVLGGSAADALTIEFVEPGGAASTADLRVSDVIIAVDNIPVLTQSELDTALKGRSPGDTIAVTVRRASTTVTAPVTLTFDSAAL